MQWSYTHIHSIMHKGCYSQQLPYLKFKALCLFKKSIILILKKDSKLVESWKHWKEMLHSIMSAGTSHSNSVEVSIALHPLMDANIQYQLNTGDWWWYNQLCSLPEISNLVPKFNSVIRMVNHLEFRLLCQMGIVLWSNLVVSCNLELSMRWFVQV